MPGPIVYEEFGYGSEDAPIYGIMLHAAGAVSSFRLTSLPQHGTLYTDLPESGGVPLNAMTDYAPTGFDGDTGRWFFTAVFVPEADWNGATSFDYTAEDSDGRDSDPATVSLLVDPVDEATGIDLNGAAAGTSTDLTFTENDPILALGADAVVNDGSVTFEGASVTASFASGGKVDDLLRVGGGSISVDESDVYDGADLIGQASGGSDADTPLVITFNASATLASVQAVVRAIGFVNYSSTPVAGDRVVEILLTDAGGVAGLPVSATIHVVATVDLPIAADDAIFVSEGMVQIGSVFADNGNGPDTDQDGPALQVADVNGSAANVGQPIVLASGAIFQLNADGSFSFDPNNGYESLSEYETAQEQITYTLVDGNSATVYVTINGVNDAPIFSLAAGDSAGATLSETDGGLGVSGTLSVADADTIDNVAISLAGVTASGSTAGLGLGNAALLGMFAVTPSSGTIAADPGSTHNVAWTFDSAGQAFDYLDDGETLTLSYTVSAIDESGARTDQIVSIVITGGNDAPTLVVTGSDSASATLTETNGALTASGTLTAVDPDLSDSVTSSVLSVAATGTTAGLSSTNDALKAMLALTANVAADAGSLNNLAWSFDSGAQAFDYLGVGQTLSLNYVVRVTDDSGAIADQMLTVIIQGTNDAPVILGSTDAFGTAVEIADHAAGENVAVLTDSGTIFFADRDSTAAHAASASPLGGAYLGSFTLGAVDQGASSVGWTFTISDADLNALGAGVVEKQYYSVTIDDGMGGTIDQIVEIDLVGTNDAAALSSANVFLEQGTEPATSAGTLSIGDEDGPSLFLAQTSAPGRWGHFSIDADGNWSYAADQVFSLASGEFRTDVFTVLAVDGTPTTVAVTITGHDEPALARSDLFVTDEATPIGAGLSLFADNGNGADTDPDGALTVAAVNGVAGNVGHSALLASGARVIVNADGTFRYDPNHAFDGLNAGASASDSFTYTLAGGSTGTVYLTIAGLGTTQQVPQVGDGGDNVLTGTTGPDTFLLQQGGNDSVSGFGLDDGFYFGAAFTVGDSVDGGEGTDTLALQGNTSVALGDITDVEVILALSGSDARFGDLANNRYDYDLTSNDGNVGSGETLTVQATGLLAGEDLRFDGSAETDGNFRIFAGRGTDDVIGGDGNDGFFFGADGNLSGADHVAGRAGTDTLALRGNYVGANAVAFGDASFSGLEVVALLSSHTNEYSGQIVSTGFDYDLTMADGNVAAGGQLDINASRLAADESVRFDGRAESDGAYRILSGAGDDIAWGGSGNDTLYGGLGKDWLEGGAGSDTYIYRSAAESTSTGYDTISGFDARVDIIDAPGGTHALGQSGAGTLSTASFDSDLSAGLDGVLGAGQAALFTATAGSLSGHVFAVIDTNDIAGYQAGQDLVIELANAVSPLDPSLGFIA